MKLFSFGEFSRKSMKLVAAALFAVTVTLTPLAFDVLMDSNMVPTAAAGRPQTGPGEY